MATKAQKVALVKAVDEFIASLDQPAWEGSSMKRRDDNEAVHADYDEILIQIAAIYEPDLVARLDNAVEDINFWYA